jgi:hypothetical protein
VYTETDESRNLSFFAGLAGRAARHKQALKPQKSGAVTFLID